ncbi:hypothetical protein WA026_013843 [Henosepilachna vigintioctopunctata]|uniref:CTNNB1 binding N-teminal domain-containing protein n=1 Tax=Henosepilachna vigintioctopunctata TaxID=420089 RepID=A0AAW1UYN5_9CUCU
MEVGRDEKLEESHDLDKDNGDIDQDDFMENIENGRNGLTGTPDSQNSRNDKELEDLMDVESTAKTCIMHALSIVSTPTPKTGSSPPPLAATAPHTGAEDAWKTPGHTRLH